MDHPSRTTRRRPPKGPETPVEPAAPAVDPPPVVRVVPQAPTPAVTPVAPRDLTDFDGLSAIATMDRDEARRMMEAFSGGPRPTVLRRGDRVVGRITRMGSTVAFVHVGTKADATLDRVELGPEVGVGDEITAYIVNNPSEGEVRLTTTPSGDMAIEMLEAARAAGDSVDGRVTKRNDHGYEVQLGQGVRAFCPNSHIDRQPIVDPDAYVGQNLAFRVLEVRGREAIVSHRVIVDEAAEADRGHQLSLLVKDDVYPGVVTSLREFGAFVRLPTGVEGLVPLANLARQRVSHPKEVLQEGQEVNVRIMSVDLERGRLGLSIRHTVQPGEAAPAAPTPRTGGQGGPTRAPEPTFGVLAGLLSTWKGRR